MTAPERAFPSPGHPTRRRSVAKPARRFAARPLALALAGASLLSLPLIQPAPAHAQAALPSGLAVVHGQATAVVDGSRMTVTNSANSILNWNSFSIGAGHGVHFAQPDAASKVLNRVVGNDPSAILGSLSSNGGVWLLNPNGVLFGHGARVDVGHLVTSTLRLNDVDWLNGRFNFAAAYSDANSGIVNQGELRSSLGGHIALLGASVNNENLIEAPDGQILLAAGRSIDLVDTGSPHLRLRVNAPADAALNLGTLAAAGGRIDVHGAVVNQQGVVRADSFGVNAAGEIVLQASESIEVGAGSVTSASGGQGGRLTLDAGRSGTATIRGDLLATGHSRAGGEMTLLGQRIGLTDAARLDVSGPSGGSLHIGGGQGGRDPALPNSQALFVGSGVTLDANATGAGDGGRIVLWSDRATRVYGRLSARGGPLGGNGGFIETSGGWIDIRPAGIDASAPAGRAGSWLLDPGDITITNLVSDDGAPRSGSDPVRYESNTTGATLRAQTIQETLEGGSNVVVATGEVVSSDEDPGDIFVSSATIMPALKDGVSLALQAHRNIEISNSQIGTTGAPLSLNLQANGAGEGGKVLIQRDSAITTGGGSIAATGAGFDTSAGQHGTGILISGSTLNAGTGSVTLTGTSDAVEGFGHSGIRLSSTSIDAGSIALNGSHSDDSSESFAGVRIFGSSLTATEQLSIVGSGPGGGVLTGSDTTLRVSPLAPNPAAGMTINGTNTLAVGPTPPSANHGARLSGDYGGLLQTTNRAFVSITGSHRGGPAPSLLLTDDLRIDADGPVSLTANSPLQVGAQITSASPINLFGDDVTLLAGASLTSTATGDAIVIAGRPDPNTARFVNSAGPGALSTPSGRWLIFGRNPTLLDPGGLPHDFRQYNARFGSATPAASGNGLLYSDTRTAAIRGDRLQKTYDGSTVIGPISAANPVFSGLAPGDVASLPAGTNGSLADPHVGTSKPVAVSPLALTVQDGSGKPVFGYGLESNLRGDVTERPLTLGGVSARNKTYDGNTDAQLDLGGGLTGLVAGETLGTTVSGQFDTKDAGTGKTVTISTTLADGSGRASNYQAPPPSTTSADILRRQLTLNDVRADSKVYDGNRDAVVNFSGVGGLVGSETVATTVTGLFDTRDVGSSKPVDVGVTLGNGSNGGLAANYLPPLVTPPPRADITPRPVQANALAIADKRYDGNRDASLTLGPLSGLVPGETLTASGSGLFDSKDVGTGKPVALDVQLGNGSGGGVASNYRFVAPPDPRASITPAPLTIRADDASKTFGQTLVFSGSEFSSSGLQAGETVGSVTLASAGAVNTAPVAGSPYAIVPSNARGGSFDARNYDIAYRNGVLTVARANLQAVLVDITGNPTKVYDGSDAATLTPANFGLTGFVAGDNATVVETSGRYDSPDAGSRTVSATLTRPSYAPVGSTDLDNYQLPTLASGPGTILPRTVTLNGVQAQDKVYDGNVAATLSSPGTLAGLVGGQTLQVRPGSARFDTKDAGTGKTVTVEAISLADGSGRAANYRVAPTATTRADITPRPLGVGAITAADKVYDATTVARISGGTLSGLAGSETLATTLSGRFDTPDVGNSKPVAVTLQLGNGSNGGLAANYSLPGTPLQAQASITPATLTYAADPQRKLVGEPLPALTGSVAGFVGGETQASATSGTLRFETPATANSPAGLYPINGSGLTAGNYRFVQAPSNATALNVGGIDVALAEDSSRAALSNSRQAVTPTPFWSGPTEGRVFDVIQALRGSYLTQGALFRAIPVADMSQESLAGLLAARDRYKKALFSEAIRRLEQDPTLADLPACASVQEVDNGSCLITEDLKRQLKRERATTQFATPARPPAAVAAAPAPAPAAPAPAPDASVALIPPAPPREAVGTPLPEPAPLPFFSRRVRTAALPQIARKIAIVIGVDDYTDRRIPQLDNAVKDARTVGQLLESSLGYETVVLENASRQAVVRTLNRLAIELEPSDSVVVYYAGHGELVQETGLGYWQLSDANPNRPETWMSNADISRLIGRIGASQVALISDSCYSGSLVDERIRGRPGEVDPQQLLARKTVVVMSSGGNEPVFDEGKNGHSPFAFSLMRNLEQVSNWQVGGNVFERVRFAVARELPQRPVYGSAASAGHQAGGDYLFEQRQLAP